MRKIATILSQETGLATNEPIIAKEIHIPVYGRNSIPTKALNLIGPHFGTNHSLIRELSIMV
jgi:hypothetical protein